MDRAPRSITVEILGQVVSKTYYAYYLNESSERVEIVERCGSPSAGYGDAGSDRMVTTYYAFPDTNTPWAGKTMEIRHHDGRMDTYTYEKGAWSGDTFTAGSGGDYRRSVKHGLISNTDGVPYKSTMDRSVIDEHGNEVFRETLVYTGAGHEQVSWVKNTYDEQGHVTKVEKSDGSVVDEEWGCCGVEYRKNEQGIEMSYSHDEANRLVSTTKKGRNSPADDIVMTNTLDSSGRVITRKMSAGEYSLLSSNLYDLTGRKLLSVNRAGLVTTYAYSDSLRTRTVTRPGGATEITENHIDGRTKSVTGTGVIAQYYSYDVNEDGSQVTTVYSVSGDSPCYVKTTTDMLGRTVKEERSGYGGANVTTYTFNSLGRLEKTETTGMADTLYSYDSLGNLTNTCLDVDDDGEIDFSGMDRITVSETEYEYSDSAWWRKTTSKVLGTDNSSTATTTSINRQKLTGLGAYQAHSLTEDIHGNETVSTVTIDRENATVTRTTDVPDSECDVVSVTDNGLLVTSVSKSGITNTFVYDELERRTSVIDPRTGSHLTCYDAYGRVDFESDASGNTNFFTYDSAGRVSCIENALGLKKYISYTDRGETYRIWGDVEYPVEYGYSSYGNMVTMKTYRDGTNWNSGTWPGGTETPDTTTWQYDAASGQMTNKVYADSSNVGYSYTVDGKLSTRTWARSSGGSHVTTYSYDSDTGELTGIDYSDSTPDIVFTYNRMGQQSAVSDGVGGRGFAYNSEFQLESETITNTLSGLTHTLTRSFDDIGRNAGFALDSDYQVGYEFDSYGRMNSVSSSVYSVSSVVQYSYLSNSDLISVVSNSYGLASTRSYESSRNLITDVLNEFGTNVISRYQYTNDELGRRTDRIDTGSAISAGATNVFGYDSRSQLTSAQMTSNGYAYSYDPIGNRESATNNTDGTLSYTANELNQYTEITNGSLKSLSYDGDGNLTNDGDWAYTWDGENRLIKTESLPAVPDEFKVCVENEYDYMGRRFRKTVKDDYSGGSYTTTNVTTFIYNGWNCIAEIGSGYMNYMTWGLDVSGTLQGAGGCGGLLSTTTVTASDTNTYFYLYDGNANVVGMVDEAGSIVASYEYSPFGQTIAETGPMADQFNFGFSTHYKDWETGLYYCKRRYYSPELGRFLNHDPIEERGGFHLYTYGLNNPVTYIEIMGLYAGLPGHGDPISPSASAQLIRQLQSAADQDFDQRLSQRSWLTRSSFSIFRNLSRFAWITGGIGKDEDNKFVYTCKYGWVDHGHFYFNALSTYVAGPEWPARFGSWITELIQEVGWGDPSSAWSPEDLPSNDLGRRFATRALEWDKPVFEYRWFWTGTVAQEGEFFNIAWEWNQFLKDAGALKWNTGTIIAGKTVQQWLNEDIERYKAMREANDQSAWVHSLEEAEAYRKNQPIWKCLCDGDKPRIEELRY